MPKYKALHSIGVAHLLGSHVIPNADGIIPNGAKLELSDELLQIIGPDSFELVTEETNMSEETNTTETTPVTPETPSAEQTPSTEGVPASEASPEATPAA